MINSCFKPLFQISVLFILSFMSCRSYSQIQNQQESIKNFIGVDIPTDSIETFVTKKMQELKVQGVSMAIINDGKVVYHLAKGFSNKEEKIKVTQHSIFEGASLSKPIFAFFVMGFVEEGLLNLDKPLYEYLPNEAIQHDERYKSITARMVLSHTSGFPNWRTDYEDKKLFISFEPGSAYQYSGEGYQYLSEVLAHLLHTDLNGLEDIYQKRIAIPFGMKTTKFVQDKRNMKNRVLGYQKNNIVEWEDDARQFGSAYSIHSESLDFSNWLIGLMDKKGMSDASYSELFKDQVLMPDGHPNRNEGITSWTLGFAKASLPFGDLFAHGGNNPGFSSIFTIDLVTKRGVVIFTNADQSSLPSTVVRYLMTP